MSSGYILLGLQLAFVVVSAIIVTQWYLAPKDKYDNMLEEIMDKEEKGGAAWVHSR